MPEPKPKFTKTDRKYQRAASDIGATAGLVGGTYGGWKAVKGGQRVAHGTAQAKPGYKFSRELGEPKLKAVSSGAKAAVAGTKARARPSLLPIAGAYMGMVGGAVAGGAMAQKKVYEHQMKKKKIEKSSLSAFGVDHG